MENTPLILIQDLQKVIEQQTALEIETLSVSPGETVAVTGPVDSGKDILLELLTGKARPTLGTIRLAGLDPAEQREEFSERVGVQFAEENLYPRQSALANLTFYSRLYRLPKTRVIEVLALLGLADDTDTPVAKLSSSLARRVALGRAILHRPQVLILVEPFARVDEDSAGIMKKVLGQQLDAGAAVLIVAEDSSHLQELCDRIYRLEKGRVVEEYSPDEKREAAFPFMVPAKLEGRVALVNPAEIYYVIAQDDRAYLQTAEELVPTQFTLTELEKRLSRSGFFRAHRSYLVNLQHVKEVIPYTRDSYSLRLKDAGNTEIPLSKSAAKELKELLGY
jgi:ABC-2 type transport system ATP-binding protein